MKKTKFTEAQIVFALRQADTGVAVAEVCWKMGISEATYYSWKKSTAAWACQNYVDSSS
jgi:putative transposase